MSVSSSRRRSRIALVLSVAVAIVAPPSASAGNVATPAPQRAVTYSVGVMGLDVSRADRQFFADVVDATLNDPRGWSLNGAVRFREVRSGGDFQVTLAAASTVGRFGGCSSWWSCRSGWYVLINEMRWTGASPIYPGPANLHAYRHLVINHEVGHALGFGHSECSRAGADAYVMQQQSIRLGGCAPNPWPLPSERSSLARRLGVDLGPRPMWLQPGASASGISIGMSVRAVRARIGSPQRTRRAGARTVAVFAREQLIVEFERGLVAAVTTRNERDVTRVGVGVDTPAPRIRAITGIVCPRADATGVTRCVLGRDTVVGDRTTTFVLRGGRVVAVRVDRRTTVRPMAPAPSEPTPGTPTPEPAA